MYNISNSSEKILKDSCLIKRVMSVSDSNWLNVVALRIRNIKIHYIKGMKDVYGKIYRLLHIKLVHVVGLIADNSSFSPSVKDVIFIQKEE